MLMAKTWCSRFQTSITSSPIPFEERSHGFQWFFSFYLVFLVESEKAHEGAILLLDEPGLHLHPTLQTKLIDLFERISSDNQLLYSTHLPFLVDGNHLERVRTVHLDGPEPQKTRISNDVRPTGDRDTLFPIQVALGYSIAQTLFLGKRSVIVEGITDYWLIKTLNAVLPELDGNSALHEDTVLIPAGGTSRLMPLASIMLASTGVGEGHLMVLLDSDSAGDQAASRMNDVFSDESSVLMLGAALCLTEATIEDLIPRDVYVDAVKQAGHKITMNEHEQGAATNVEAMETAFQRIGLVAPLETPRRPLPRSLSLTHGARSQLPCQNSLGRGRAPLSMPSTRVPAGSHEIPEMILLNALVGPAEI